MPDRVAQEPPRKRARSEVGRPTPLAQLSVPSNPTLPVGQCADIRITSTNSAREAALQGPLPRKKEDLTKLIFFLDHQVNKFSTRAKEARAALRKFEEEEKFMLKARCQLLEEEVARLRTGAAI